VQKERQLATQLPVVERRTGTDGKTRQMPQPRVQKPSSAEPEGRVQPATKPQLTEVDSVNEEEVLIARMMTGPVNEIRATFRKLSPRIRISARRQILDAISDAMLKEPDEIGF
jgi:hypothetical protein